MIYKTWPATLKSLKPVQDFIDALAVEAGAGGKQLLSIRLIVEEVVVNIITYAYPKDDSGEIGVEFQASGNEITISFTDTGPPFDPLNASAPDIKQSIVDRRVGGLGIFMVRQIADDVRYLRCDNRNILSVKLNLPVT